MRVGDNGALLHPGWITHDTTTETNDKKIGDKWWNNMTHLRPQQQQRRRRQQRRHRARGHNNLSATPPILTTTLLLLLFLVDEICLFSSTTIIKNKNGDGNFNVHVQTTTTTTAEALLVPTIIINSRTPSGQSTSLHRPVVSKSQQTSCHLLGKFCRPIDNNVALISPSSTTSQRPTSQTGLGMTTDDDGSNSNNEKQIRGYVNMALSVDGFIAGPNGELDWLNEQPPPDPNVDGNDFEDFLRSVDCMVMGRTTFEVVVGFGKDIWPYGQLPIKIWTRDPTKVVIPDYLKKSTTTTTTTSEGGSDDDDDGDQSGDGSSSSSSRIGNVEARSASSPKHLFEELQKEGYRNVYIDGGKTVRDFLHAGLITRMTLSRVPILLGTGISLFDDSAAAEGSSSTTTTTTTSSHSLKHVSTKVLTNGMVQTVYDVV